MNSRNSPEMVKPHAQRAGSFCAAGARVCAPWSFACTYTLLPGAVWCLSSGSW